jgi:Protein kinase domain
MDQATTPWKEIALPVLPRRPALERTISSPPLSPTSPSRVLEREHQLVPSSPKAITTQLTPPTSPKLVRSNTDFGYCTTTVHGRKSSSPTQPNLTCVEDNVARKDIPLIIECPFEVEIAKNHSGRPRLFGQGAWSKVYRAIGRQKYLTSTPSSTGALTPPPSPQTSAPLLIAVKAPISNAAQTILRNEAITLSHLTRTPGHEDFIVPFYGCVLSSASLVLGPVPLPLCDHLVTRTRLACSNHSGLLPAEPILGSTSAWLSLAAKLITALAWLHETARVVHGDVKPGNILLSPNRSSGCFPFDPLLADFSSSHLSSSMISTPNTLSALTCEYSAPELLSPSVLRDPSSTATPASDVFSLAVTLVVAATGELTVYPGSKWQRQHFATQAWNLLEFVRNGESGARVPRGGVVESVVEGAVRRVDGEAKRIKANEWKELIGRVVRDEQMRQNEDGIPRTGG